MKNKKQLGALLIAAAMAVSAVQAVSMGAEAADVPEFEFEIRTDAAKTDRTDTVTISTEELAKGDVTFSAGGYIVSADQFPTESYINNVAMAWEPIDENGSSVYRYIRFSNVQDKVNAIGSGITHTLSNGTTITTDFNLHCLSVANRRTGVISAASQWTQTLKINLEEIIDGNTIYSDGNGGCYFVRDIYGAEKDENGETPQETIYPEVEYNEDTKTATLRFPYIDKTTKAETTAVQEVLFYDNTLPADTVMPGTNNLDYSAYSGANGASKFLGSSSDELAYTTFDVTIKSDTPVGTYYIALDDSRLNQVTTVDWKAYTPSNIEINYGEAGSVLGYNRNDPENWLKIIVSDKPAETTTTTTTTTTTSTTTASTTTTTEPVTTTTSSTTTKKTTTTTTTTTTSTTTSTTTETTPVTTTASTTAATTTSVTLTIADEAPYLSDTALTMYPGMEYELTVYNTSGEDYTWNSTNAGVASISENGIITAHTPGTARIYTLIRGKLLYCNVTVLDGLCGDVNLDERVSLVDAVCLNKYNVGIVALNNTALYNADCLDDNTINADDAVVLLKHLADLIEVLPYTVS